MGRVFVDECEREEACVSVKCVVVRVDVLNSTHRVRCPKLDYQPSALIYANYSRPP
jgi:hypothetical protein